MTKKYALRWALVCWCSFVIPSSARAAAPASQPDKPERSEIVRVDKDSITAMPPVPPKDGRADEPVTYRLDENTRISVSRLTQVHATPDGGQKRTYDSKPGGRDDLKVGLRARIVAKDGTATRISVFIDEPK